MSPNEGKVLVTGANGFIGATLCKQLLRMGCYVRTLSRHPNTFGNENWIMDLAVGNCPEGLCTGIDTVFHLAGKAHALAENSQDAAEYRQINTEGTRKLLEAAQRAGVKRFIFFSSVKAAGDSPVQPMDETVATPADTPYGQSKYEAEQLVLHGGYVPHPVVIRPCMVYGNSDKGNLPRMIKAVAKCLFPPLPDNHNRRSMVHVDDVIRAALLAAEKPEAAGQLYIVSDGHSYSTRRIYDWIRMALGKSPAQWTIPLSILNRLAKSGDAIGRLSGRRFLFDSDALDKLTGSACYSSAKIERELGFSPKQTLKESLPDIIRYLNLI
ncbi:MAG TPA: NAD-dependent dehydratase [Fibrobacteres bacterium]|nr:NAD-dependent dehydratase [Fibrobacterota bacterium]